MEIKLNTDITYVRLVNRVYIKSEDIIIVYNMFKQNGIEIAIGSSCYVHDLSYIDKIYLKKKVSLNTFKQVVQGISGYIIKYNDTIYMQVAMKYEIPARDFYSDLVYMEIVEKGKELKYNLSLEKFLELTPKQQSLVKRVENPLDKLFTS